MIVVIFFVSLFDANADALKLGSYGLQFTVRSSSTMNFEIRANGYGGKSVKITKCSFNCWNWLERPLVASTNSRHPAWAGWWEARQILARQITMYFKQLDGGVRTLYYNSNNGITSEGTAYPDGCESSSCRGVRMWCGGRWVCTKILNRHTLAASGYGAYIQGTHACDNLRKQGQFTKWQDAKNQWWRVDWGASVSSMCFPGSGEVYFKQGSITERQGFDRHTQFLCCSFRKKSGGWMRDDFTQVCCDAYYRGSGSVDFQPDHFGNLIQFMNAGAPYATAVAQVAAASYAG